MVSGLIPVAVSDVPGPNSYTVNPGQLHQLSADSHFKEHPVTDSQLDAYKHGAFIEKADRFTEAKPSDVPGKPDAPRLPPVQVDPNTLPKDRARIPNLITVSSTNHNV